MTIIKLIYLFCGYLVLVNIIAFILFGIDKSRAKQGRHSKKQRIEEATLLWMAAFGGSIGAILGMHVFHHKTHHKKFTILLPLILLLQLALAGYAIYQGCTMDRTNLSETKNSDNSIKPQIQQL